MSKQDRIKAARARKQGIPAPKAPKVHRNKEQVIADQLKEIAKKAGFDTSSNISMETVEEMVAVPRHIEVLDIKVEVNGAAKKASGDDHAFSKVWLGYCAKTKKIYGVYNGAEQMVWKVNVRGIGFITLTEIKANIKAIKPVEPNDDYFYVNADGTVTLALQANTVKKVNGKTMCDGGATEVDDRLAKLAELL